MMRTALLCVLLLGSALAAQQSDRPALPRVLLIGDSISIGYTDPVRELLTGRAEVHRVKGNAGDTAMGLARLDEWLAPELGPWDVIHFNWGLWDLCYRHPDAKTQGNRDKVHGTVTHTPEQYAANLDAIITRLEQANAELIFAMTTPVPEGELGRKVGDDLRYNEKALTIMRRRGVAIDDLHAVMRDKMAEYARQPGDVHFTERGSQMLAEQVVASIDRQLKQRASGKVVLKTQTPTKAPTWTPTRHIPYATIGDVTLELHVFEPDHHSSSASRPAIVFFFGGGWIGGKIEQFYPHCDYLAGRSMVAIAAEYRVKNVHGTTPFECVADGLAAVRYVREHAAALGIDPKRIAAAGGSAGGHVAAATATVAVADGDRPDALVLFNPVYDNGPGGYGHERLGERYREISPLHNIRKGMPPTIVFLGTEDRLIPVTTARRFQAAMQAVGSRSELVLYEGRQHGFFNYGNGDGRDYLTTVRAMDEFLTSLGYLEGKPTVRAPGQ
jgi:acetyl esterase